MCENKFLSKVLMLLLHIYVSFLKFTRVLNIQECGCCKKNDS